MPANLSSKIPETPLPGAAEKATARGSGILRWLPFLFALVLAATLSHHFLGYHVRETFVFDGNHYLLTCQKVTEFLISALRGHPDAAMLFNQDFIRIIVWDGPVIPSIPALVFSVIGHVPSASDWKVVMVIYAVIHALSACMTAVAGFRLTGRQSLAAVAGLLFGLYPPAIIATGRYCSEVPATFFILAFVLSLCNTREKLLARLLPGIAGGLLAMSKPVLIPTIIAAVVLTGLGAQRKITFFLTVSLAILLTIFPWAAYTRLATGKASITAERGPTYNAAVACDLDSDGWCTMPESPIVQLHSTDCSTRLVDKEASPLPVLLSGWLTHPRECLALSQRKLTRLFGSPWNDFRETVFGLPVSAQQIMHLILLSLGLCGAFSHLLDRKRLSDERTRLLADLLVLFLIGHLGFAVFQAMGRYAITAMPCLAALSSLGLLRLLSSKQTAPSNYARAVLPAASLALLTAGGICFADPVTRLGESQELAHILAQGDSAEKSLDLCRSHLSANPEAILLLIDADRHLNGARITVNGHILTQEPRSFNHFNAAQYLLFNTMREHSHYMRIGVDDFRQWRAVPVPAAWLNLSGSNLITVTATASPLTLFSDTRPSNRTMLSPAYFASDKMVSALNSLDPRIPSTTLTGSVSESSTLVPSHQATPIRLPDSLRIKLAVALKNPEPVRRPSAPQIARSGMASEFAAQLSAQDKLIADGSCHGLRINRYILKTARSTIASCAAPPLKDSSHFSITVKGKLRILKGDGAVGLPITIYGANGEALVLGRSPNFIRGTGGWTSFSISDLVPSRIIGGALTKVTVTLFPCPWQGAWYGCSKDASDAQLTDLTVHVVATDLPELSDKRVVYY